MKRTLVPLILLALCFLVSTPAESALSPAPLSPAVSSSNLPPAVDPQPYPFSDRYPVLIAVPHPAALQQLYAMNLDLDGMARAANGTRLLTAFVSPAEAAALAKAGFDFVPIPNEGYNSFLAHGPFSMAPDPWPTYEEFVTRMQALEIAYPALVDLTIIGSSTLDVPIYCLQISDNVGIDEYEPEFRYVSTMHGDETTGVEMTLRLAELLTASYGVDSALTALVNEIEIWICPIYNPDGYIAGSRYNANGIDLNRNYPDRFTDPVDDPAGHEIETQVFMNFGYDHHFVMGANYHGGTLVLNYPWDAVAAPGDPIIATYAPDDTLFHSFGYGYTSLNLPMFESTSFVDGLTRGWEWYQIYGGMQDWAYVYRGEHHVTIEVSFTGSPNYSQMDDYWADNRDAMLWWMSQVVTGFRGQVLDARDGAPLEAVVSVDGMEFPNYARTDPAVGDYHRVILGGDYTLTASADGYLGQSAPVTVITGTVATQAFYLCPAAMITLQGTVTQARTGLPLAATVELVGSPLSASTDPLSGFYTIGVCPSAYTLRASAPGYIPEERLVSLSEASTQDFILTLIDEPLATFLPFIIR
jgi:hypothetical protein